MNILITGAGGFIGTNLYNNLKKKYDVTCIFSSSQKACKQNNYSVDLTKRTEVEALIQDLSWTNFDTVIHLASKMASPERIEDMTIFKDNIEMTENLVFLVNRLEPRLLINFSTMSVYPNVTGLFSEMSLPMPQKNPDCLYGLSKYASEIVLDFLLRNEDIRIVHLRVGQVYGNGMRWDRIIPVMRKELEEKNTITVYGNGERQSCFIEVGNLVKTVDHLMQREVEGVFNVGDDNMSYFNLAEKIIEKYGNNGSVIIKKSQGHQEKFNLDTSKILKTMEH